MANTNYSNKSPSDSPAPTNVDPSVSLDPRSPLDAVNPQTAMVQDDSFKRKNDGLNSDGTEKRFAGDIDKEKRFANDPNKQLNVQVQGGEVTLSNLHTHGVIMKVGKVQGTASEFNPGNYETVVFSVPRHEGRIALASLFEGAAAQLRGDAGQSTT